MGIQVTNECFIWFNPVLQPQHIFMLQLSFNLYATHLQVHRILMRTQYGEKRNQIGK